MASEATLIHIANCTSNERGADVVFVHGLDGDPRSTWMPTPPRVGPFRRLWEWLTATQQVPQANAGFWPEWLASEFPQVGIWSLAYPAGSTAWLGTAMPLPDRARQVLQLMRLKGLGQRPLVFIVHSLGGLLVKELLRTAHTQNNAEWKEISAATTGILFLATPHSGASLATLVDLFRAVTRRNWTIRDLAAHEPHLRDLNEWFRSNFD
jgi:triacylglycerol esterase/lipase EstA (alpha/beta hydrolase family)